MNTLVCWDFSQEELADQIAAASHAYYVQGWSYLLGQSVFCFEICTPEGRGGENGGSANFKIKHTEPLTQDIR